MLENETNPFANSNQTSGFDAYAAYGAAMPGTPGYVPAEYASAEYAAQDYSAAYGGYTAQAAAFDPASAYDQAYAYAQVDQQAGSAFDPAFGNDLYAQAYQAAQAAQFAKEQAEQAVQAAQAASQIAAAYAQAQAQLAEQAAQASASAGAGAGTASASNGFTFTDAEVDATIYADEIAALDATQKDVEALSECIINSEPAYQGSFLQVDDTEVFLPDGSIMHHDVVRHPGAVGIIAVHEGNVLLVRQYRTALERLTLEIPAGKIEHGEDLYDCARRELEEETGFTADTLEYLQPIAVAAGYSDEVLHLFLATDLHPCPTAHPDEDEFLAVTAVSVGAFISACQQGKLEDSKTLVAALVCQSKRLAF